MLVVSSVDLSILRLCVMEVCDKLVCELEEVDDVLVPLVVGKEILPALVVDVVDVEPGLKRLLLRVHAMTILLRIDGNQTVIHIFIYSSRPRSFTLQHCLNG